MRDPLYAKDPHKCALIWSSKAYRIINTILRKEETFVDLDQRKFKYTKRFLHEFLSYFKSHGKSKESLEQDTDKLYRGLLDFKFVDTIHDYGFISTSKNKDVAKSFAKDKGIVLTFKTNKLPDTIPFVIIDSSLRDYLHEEEVLLLPGTIDIRHRDNYAIYNVNQEVEEYMSQINLQQSGGLPPHLGLNIPIIDLKGKYVVWWRAIHKRPLEILNIVRLPRRSDKKVLEFWRKTINHADIEYDALNRFIPSYQDLMQTRPKTDKIRKELNSYNVYMAIYDAKNKKVDHFHFGIVDEFLPEIDYNKKHERTLESILVEKKML